MNPSDILKSLHDELVGGEAERLTDTDKIIEILLAVAAEIEILKDHTLYGYGFSTSCLKTSPGHHIHRS